MGKSRASRHRLIERILGWLVRRHSTAVVVFHQAIAQRLGLGPTDHKCFDLLRERGAMTGSDLASITGLTSGAITGVVARLERTGYLRREIDPHDRRQQFLSAIPERMQDFHEVFAPIHHDVSAVLNAFDAHQLAAIAEFLNRSADLAYHHVALLRARVVGGVGPTGRRLRPDMHVPPEGGHRPGTELRPRRGKSDKRSPR